MIDNTNSLKKKETDMNFDYISTGRYIVEIMNKDWKQPLFTKRMKFKSTAETVKDGHNRIKGFTAKIHDTKTGEII